MQNSVAFKQEFFGFHTYSMEIDYNCPLCTCVSKNYKTVENLLKLSWIFK